MNKVLRKYSIALASLALSLCSSVLAAPTSGPLLRELGRTIPFIHLAGFSGYGIADLDGDGVEDIAVGGVSGGWDNFTSLVKIYGVRQGHIRPKQDIVVSDGTLAQVLAWTTSTGDAKLLTILDDGRAIVWSGWPLERVRTFSVGENVAAAAIGDVDIDGQLDLITATYNSLTAYDLATGVSEWAIAGSTLDIAVAQLDADLPLEIVAAGASGVVIDGATQAIEWSYSDGYGRHVAAGAIAPGGSTGFVGVTDDDFRVFQGSPFSPLWDFTGFRIEHATVADLDGDGQAEIIAGGPNRFDDISVYDTVTHAVRTTIVNPASGGNLRHVAAVDVLGDGHPLVVYSAYPDHMGLEVPFYLADPVTGTVESGLTVWRSGPYSAVAIGDLDEDSVVELAYGAAGYWNEGESGGLSVIDVPAGALEWQALDVGYDPSLTPEIAPVALCLQGDQLVVVGDAATSGRVIMLDAQTHEVAWLLDSETNAPMLNRQLTDVALWDVNGDFIKDAVVTAGAAGRLASGATMYVFSGTDGALLWQSIDMGFGFGSGLGLIVGDTGYGGGPQAVAVLSHSLRAYDLQTGLLEWILEVEADGASLIPVGTAGIELGVFIGNSLSFYDGASHSLLRSFTLNGDITALRELGDIHHLLVAVGGRLAIVDGTNGAVLSNSEYLGPLLGDHNQLAATETASGSWLIGAGSKVGVFRYRHDRSEHIFADDFDGNP